MSDAFTITTPIVVIVNYDKMLDTITKAFLWSLTLTDNELNEIDRKLREAIPATFTLNQEAPNES